MKATVTTIRIVVGVLFILSGLVKANDPLGLSYKMQEFFEVWNSSLAVSSFPLKNGLIRFLTFSNAHALFLSITMIVLEIMAGVALLVGWQKRFVLTLLGVLILFFTFLTGYAYASGKFKNCGCFGDCLPITPLTSFLKDIVLLVLIAVLWFGRNYIQPLQPKRTQWVTLGFFLLLSIGLQWFVLSYLPVADCLPFKKGASIPQGMKTPVGAVPDSFAIQFIYERDGKRHAFFPENLPADLATYKFVDRTDKLVRKGNAEPPIRGFALTGVTDTDSTNAVLEAPHAVLYFYETRGNVPQAIAENLQFIYREAAARNILVYIVSTSLNGKEQLRAALPELPFFKVDFTAYRTAARTNPTIYVLQKGTIVDKRSRLQTNSILKTLQSLR
jgi:uncharacterized membrane protein YphA (DoxX/SURF4 family)